MVADQHEKAPPKRGQWLISVHVEFNHLGRCCGPSDRAFVIQSLAFAPFWLVTSAVAL